MLDDLFTCKCINGTYSLGRGGAFEEKEETWWICSTIYSDATQGEKKTIYQEAEKNKISRTTDD